MFRGGFRVGVAGGELWVAAAGAALGAEPPVLLVHGISSHHLSWVRVVRELASLAPEAPVLAVDVRGRGRSSELGGPFGAARHAADALAVLDHVGWGRAVLGGHSMGAWVVARLAAEHPERVAAAVLVDGGVAREASPAAAADPDAAVDRTLGPALERLRRTWASPREYLEFWRAHPAVGGERFTDDVRAWALNDLVGEPTGLRVRVTEAAVREDYRDILLDPGTVAAAWALRVPAHLLRAERGLADEVPPFVDAGAAREWAERVAGARLTEMPGVNHYTATLGAGAPTVAAALAEAWVGARSRG